MVDTRCDSKDEEYVDDVELGAEDLRRDHGVDDEEDEDHEAQAPASLYCWADFAFSYSLSSSRLWPSWFSL